MKNFKKKKRGQIWISSLNLRLFEYWKCKFANVNKVDEYDAFPPWNERSKVHRNRKLSSD